MPSQVKRQRHFGRANVKLKRTVAELSLNKTVLQGCHLRSCKRHDYSGRRRTARASLRSPTPTGSSASLRKALASSSRESLCSDFSCMPDNRPSEILLSPDALRSITTLWHSDGRNDRSTCRKSCEKRLRARTLYSERSVRTCHHDQLQQHSRRAGPDTFMKRQASFARRRGPLSGERPLKHFWPMAEQARAPDGNIMQGTRCGTRLPRPGEWDRSPRRLIDDPTGDSAIG
ncbi:hypothetical protein EV131_12050 [Rhizobium laguerreae]|uniref:Uncharacterized protein n=1 Tax=Rhizobium laguerreae TaxID=1076926 RepID=A0AAX2QD97_9HYPH|nr:hypothetical protein EV131_12050 [Rhizobium laguerreae]